MNFIRYSLFIFSFFFCVIAKSQEESKLIYSKDSLCSMRFPTEVCLNCCDSNHNFRVSVDCNNSDNPSPFIDLNITILNRWGNVVYESNDFIGAIWDDSFDSRLVNEGTYTCMISYVEMGTKKTTKNEMSFQFHITNH